MNMDLKIWTLTKATIILQKAHHISFFIAVAPIVNEDGHLFQSTSSEDRIDHGHKFKSISIISSLHLVLSPFQPTTSAC